MTGLKKKIVKRYEDEKNEQLYEKVEDALKELKK